MSDHITSIVMDFGDRDGMLAAINAHIYQRIAQARQEALEEAAAAVEGMGCLNPPMSFGVQCADAIRALATEPASRAMLPVTDSVDTPEFCRLLLAWHDARVDRSAGTDVSAQANAIVAYVNEFIASRLASPVAGWVSVEERLPGEQGFDSEQVLVFLNGHCGLHDMACRRGGGWGVRLGFFDAEKQVFRVGGSVELDVTHWADLPPAPVTPKQEQSNG